MPVAQLNVRLDVALKREGDATLARYGASASDAIRALWQYLATEKTLPSFMREAADAEEPHASSNLAASGAGLAVQLALAKGLELPSEDLSYDELREAAFEELLEEGKVHV